MLLRSCTWTHFDDYEKEIIQYGSGEDIEDMVNAYISDSDLNYHLNDELEEALVIVTNFEHIAFVDTNRL